VTRGAADPAPSLRGSACFKPAGHQTPTARRRRFDLVAATPIAFSDMPLSDVVAEFNRYDHHQMRVEGTAVQRIRMNGTFHADQSQALILCIYHFGNQDTLLAYRRDGTTG